MMARLRNQSGNLLLGAMIAVVMAGTVGAAMVAMYESYVKLARYVFVKAAMAAVDNKVRYLAMQPYAYTCGKESTGDELGGVGSCVLNTSYFSQVSHVALPGTCALDPSCGFRLIFDPDQKDPASKRGFQVQSRGGVQTGVFLYNLVYEGRDFNVRPAGQNLDAQGREQGMIIPREVLQSEDFDCAAANGGATPVFQGFGADGRPICIGFNTCPAKSYATSVNFNTQRVECQSLDSSRTTVDCRPQGQSMIASVNWQGPTVTGACGELPIPPAPPASAGGAAPPPAPIPSPTIPIASNPPAALPPASGAGPAPASEPPENRGGRWVRTFGRGGGPFAGGCPFGSLGALASCEPIGAWCVMDVAPTTAGPSNPRYYECVQ